MAITNASTATDGTQGNAVSSTSLMGSQISADGRYVVFLSEANNLVSGDSNAQTDIFVKDTQTGTITRVSTASDGTQANDASANASISADGRYVAFQSSATNLVSGDTNGQADIFVKDTRTGAITRVSTAANGTQANGASSSGAISGDGTRVVFGSIATNLVGGDTNGADDVFVKTLGTGAITRVSTDGAGGEANASSRSASISADGTRVAFQSNATNLVSGDTNGRQDIFVKNVDTGAITLASTSSTGTQSNGTSGSASISGDGTHVAFESSGSNLVSDKTNTRLDIFVKDLGTGTITRASTDSTGAEANSGLSRSASISADGTRVAFQSSATNLVASDTNGQQDIFIKDLGTGNTTRVSANNAGTQSNGTSSSASISANGRYVAFQSAADNLVPGDANGQQDVFVADVVCYAGGTRIRTVRGEVAVEDLVVGDLAVTASGEPRPVRWLGHRTIPCRGRADRLPVRIAAGAFGPDRPARDLLISPGHALCLDLFGEVLIPAGRLVNGSTITQDPVERVTYWHVELESHDILLAENLPAESYLDVGNRAFFAGARTVDLTLGPDAPAARIHADFCRPLHADGPLVDVVRARLRDRAEAAGWRLVAGTPGDLHLVADGVTIRPEMDGLVARFVLPAGAGDVCLVSPTGVPIHVEPASGDPRRLGLALTGLAVTDTLTGTRAIALDDARLGPGFHPVEGADGVFWRWTDGAARLPAALWAGCKGPLHLHVTLAGNGVPRWVGPDAAQALEPADLRHCA